MFGNMTTDEVFTMVERRVEADGHRHSAVTYCETCMKMTWIVNHDAKTLQAGLLCHEKNYRNL